MIRVLDEERSLSFYQTAFGLTKCDRIDFDSFTLVYLNNAESSFELELTINKERKDPYDLGDGYGHLAVCVDDLDMEHTQMKNAGLAPRDIVSFDHDGALLAKFFFIADPDGYQIEVIQKGGRFG